MVEEGADMRFRILSKHVFLISLFGFLFLLIISGCTNSTSAKNNESGSQAVTPASLTHIIFITTSKGCECTMTRCKNGEAALNEAIAKLAKAPPLERVDYAKDPKRVRELIGKYPASLLPIIYFLDSNQNLLWKVEGYFDRAEVSRALQQYWGDKP